MISTPVPFHKSLNGRLLAALVLIALISVGGLGLAAYLDERAALERQVINQLTSVADLKKEQIVIWLRERQADAQLLAVNKLNQEHFSEILSQDVPPNRKAEFLEFMTSNFVGVQESRIGYSEVAFVDMNGVIVVSTDPAQIGQPTAHDVVFRETLSASDEAYVEDIHFNPNTELTTMSFGHIVYGIDLETGQVLPEVIGIIHIIVNMDETIYPLIRAWPGMGGTGETLLSRAEGNGTLYLNNLRFDEDAALNLRIPTDSPEAKSAYLASRGNEGIIETTDYRGIPVLAAYRHIPDIGWGFVAKEDLDEAFAPVNNLAHRIGQIAVAVLVVAGLASVVISRTLTHPLAELVEGTRAVAAGDLSIEVNVARQDEFGVLASSFNSMTLQLKQTLEGLKQHVIDLQRAEAALRESEEKFRSLLESAAEGIVVVDNTGSIELVNAEIELMFGYSRNELLGQSIEILLPEELRSLHTKHRNDYLAHPHIRPMGRNLDLVGRRKDRSQFPVEIGLSFIETQAGMLTMGFVMDITERKQSETALRKAHDELEDRIEERTAELQVANLQLQQKIVERKLAQEALALARDRALEASRLKSELLAKVSHELRTPLGAVLGYTELLQNGTFGPISEQQIEATAEVIDSTQYLTALVNELLDQAQLEAGKLALNVAPFTPRDLITQVEGRMSVLAQAKGLSLTTVIEADIPDMLAGDRSRLQQILVNLVSNAIKFTKTGTVGVRLYCPDASHWAMQVSDTGSGIPIEAQNDIFEPFHQIDGSTTREQTGSGLGLSIVKQLTALMKGQVILESEVGRGSTFTILLPLSPIQEKIV